MAREVAETAQNRELLYALEGGDEKGGQKGGKGQRHEKQGKWS